LPDNDRQFQRSESAAHLPADTVSPSAQVVENTSSVAMKRSRIDSESGPSINLKRSKTYVLTEVPASLRLTIGRLKAFPELLSLAKATKAYYRGQCLLKSPYIRTKVGKLELAEEGYKQAVAKAKLKAVYVNPPSVDEILSLVHSLPFILDKY
jgi:hypothetical protein